MFPARSNVVCPSTMVDNNYMVSEDAIGLYTTTLAMVVKGILIHALPLSLCHRQKYDGAANIKKIERA